MGQTSSAYLSTDNEALHEYFQPSDDSFPVSNMCNENTDENDVIEDAIYTKTGEIKNVIFICLLFYTYL